jgi:hypothetical protein
LQNIFSGNALALTASVYDVYADFISHGEIYHRITILYSDDVYASGRYVLDPLRGNRMTTPQLLSGYLAYYADEKDVHWYIGKGYSPLLIKDDFIHYDANEQVSIDEISAPVFVSDDTILEEEILS